MAGPADRRLIEEKGVSFVAVEGDWPDCMAVHQCVTAVPGAPDDPLDVLEGSTRRPAWMWANTDVVAFARWLRQHNAHLPQRRRVGFFGLDIYFLWESLHAVLDHLPTPTPTPTTPARSNRRWRRTAASNRMPRTRRRTPVPPS